MSKTRQALELARNVIVGFIEGADHDCGEPDCGDCKAYRPAWAALPAIDAALAEPEPRPVAFDYLQAHTEAEQFVRGSLLWKRFIDGTPLSNDIAVWMADFARKYAAPVAAPAQISDKAIMLRAVANRLLNALENIHGSGSCCCVMQSDDRCVFCAARAVLAAGGK